MTFSIISNKIDYVAEFDDNVEPDALKMIDGKFKWSENGRALSTCTLKQSVLPQGLLEAFVTMPLIIPVDIKIDCVCAFPAVLLTVGAENWSLLKSAYSKLAFDSEVRNYFAGFLLIYTRRISNLKFLVFIEEITTNGC